MLSLYNNLKNKISAVESFCTKRVLNHPPHMVTFYARWPVALVLTSSHVHYVLHRPSHHTTLRHAS